MGIADYSEYDGLGLAELVARGEVSPAELIEEAIERIAYREIQAPFSPRTDDGTKPQSPRNLSILRA